VPDQDRFRVYRMSEQGEDRQEMIVGHPQRGWICATETTEKRAHQWAHTYSLSDADHVYEVREVIFSDTLPQETTMRRFRNGRSFA
jgi:hypothetical protein